MPTPSRQQKWANALAWANANADVGAEDRDEAADGGYHRQFMPEFHADATSHAAAAAVPAVDAVAAA